MCHAATCFDAAPGRRHLDRKAREKRTTRESFAARAAQPPAAAKELRSSSQRSLGSPGRALFVFRNNPRRCEKHDDRVSCLVSAARSANSRVIVAETYLRPQAFLVAAHPTKRPQSSPPRSVDRSATSPCSNRVVNRLPPPLLQSHEPLPRQRPPIGKRGEGECNLMRKRACKA
jgi:hypothetical protein